jgi:putative nucleotidyltransferase with HDIG domain
MESEKTMRRVNLILNNPLFKENISLCEEYERDREFCKHDIQHSLDVARIMYIKTMEKKISIDKELIYATALLHDIGRAKQYKFSIPHEIGGKQLAVCIMKEVGFNVDEIEFVSEIISNHRGNQHQEVDDLESYFYQADFMARSCYICNAREKCKWTTKNDILVY